MNPLKSTCRTQINKWSKSTGKGGPSPTQVIQSKCSRSKVCEPYVVSLLKWATIFELYMGKIGVKNGHQSDKYYNNIR